eukprot:gene2609-3310_t
MSLRFANRRPRRTALPQCFFWDEAVGTATLSMQFLRVQVSSGKGRNQFRIRIRVDGHGDGGTLAMASAPFVIYSKLVTNGVLPCDIPAAKRTRAPRPDCRGAGRRPTARGCVPKCRANDWYVIWHPALTP